MAQIKKLQIEGIRSYKEPAIIEFFTPLTLIVGANGAGKTVCCVVFYWSYDNVYTLYIHAALLKWRAVVIDNHRSIKLHRNWRYATK